MQHEISLLIRAILDETPCEAKLGPLMQRLKECLDRLSGFVLEAVREADAEHGVLLSPTQAADCLLGGIRTQKYWQALLSAIENQDNNKPVRVLYPGCGPYATLVLPVLANVIGADIELVLLDANQGAADNLERLITELDAKNKVKRIVIANALDYAPESQPDILILECLYQGLHSEGQVAITNHFAPHLAANGVIIPREIEITANLVDIAAETGLVQQSNERGKGVSPDKLTRFRTGLGVLFVLDKRTYLQVAEGDDCLPCAELTVPELPQGHVFSLSTRLILDDAYILEEYENGITCPFIPPFSGAIKPGARNCISYQLGRRPGFVLCN